MHLNLTADELLTTTRSVRKRLDFDRPVERAVVEECLEIAFQAPTGGNRQGWHWVVVEDQGNDGPSPTSTGPTGRCIARCHARTTTTVTAAASGWTRFSTRRSTSPTTSTAPR